MKELLAFNWAPEHRTCAGRILHLTSPSFHSSSVGSRYDWHGGSERCGDFREHSDGEGRVRIETLLRLAAKPKLFMANVEATCGSPPVTSWFVRGSDPFPQSQEQWGETGLAIRRPGFYFVLCHQLAGVLGHDFEILCRPSLRSWYRRTVLCRASCVALSLALSMVLQAPLPAGSASPILRGAGLAQLPGTFCD